MTSKIKTKIALLCLKFGKQRRGSLLLEIAIGLSIFSIISGFFITKTITANRAMRVQKTKNNIEIVTSALAAYLASNNRLPRPSSNNNGLESDNTICDIGTVPYNSLGIPQKNSLDGNSRPLIYIVEINFTDTFSSIYETNATDVEIGGYFRQYFCKTINNPKIKIALQTTNKDIVAFVIDTEDNKPIVSENEIIIKPSVNTFWIRRNTLLIQYIKCGSCESRIKTVDTSQDFDPFAQV